MTTIYVGMALTDAPKEFRDRFQAELKDKLRALSEVEVFDFVGVKAGTDVDVYATDRRLTETCDLMIAICDYASLGLGMELAFRFTTGKPLLLFTHDDEHVSRMVTSFAKQENIPNYRFNEISDIVDQVKGFLSQ